MSLAKTLLTAFVALSLAATASAQIRSAGAAEALAAKAEVVITNSSFKTKTTETDLYRLPYLEAATYTVRATVEVAAQADCSAPEHGAQPRNETSTTTLGDL